MIRWPKTVTILVNNFDAWIIGSAANPEVTEPRDYDVMVPFYKWHDVTHLIPADATPNLFGGWSWKENDKDIDLWPDPPGAPCC